MKTQIKRCRSCKKKNTLIDISSEMQQINPFTIRSYVGIRDEDEEDDNNSDDNDDNSDNNDNDNDD